MSASAPASRRFFGPVAQSMIGTRSSAQRIRAPAASSPAIHARSFGTVSASSAVGTGFSPSVRTALSPRPIPSSDAAGVQVGERRVRARRDGRVARQRVRDAAADLDPVRRGERMRHVDVEVLPEHLAVDEPASCVACALGGLHRPDEDGEVLREEVRAELHASPARSASVSSSDRTSPQPTRIISSAGSCRCGSVVPVQSSTTIGLKSRNIASFDVAATH